MVTSIACFRAKTIFPRIPHIHPLTAKSGHNLGFFVNILSLSEKINEKYYLSNAKTLYLYRKTNDNCFYKNL